MYDADGNVSEIAYPSGRTVAYTRDSLGRVAGVTTKKDASSATVTLASDVERRFLTGNLKNVRFS